MWKFWGASTSRIIWALKKTSHTVQYSCTLRICLPSENMSSAYVVPIWGLPTNCMKHAVIVRWRKKMQIELAWLTDTVCRATYILRNKPRATSNWSGGRIWPPGRTLDMPGLKGHSTQKQCWFILHIITHILSGHCLFLVSGLFQLFVPLMMSLVTLLTKIIMTSLVIRHQCWG